MTPAECGSYSAVEDLKILVVRKRGGTASLRPELRTELRKRKERKRRPKKRNKKKVEKPEALEPDQEQPLSLAGLLGALCLTTVACFGPPSPYILLRYIRGGRYRDGRLGPVGQKQAARRQKRA